MSQQFHYGEVRYVYLWDSCEIRLEEGLQTDGGFDGHTEA